MTEPRWLTRSIVEAVHAALIEEHGGSHGIRDDGLIESALSRSRHQWAYSEDADLAALAAAYGYGLAKNHGFIDGNKRVALAAATVFLRMNRQSLQASEPDAVVTMLEVASGQRNEERFAAWIRERTVPWRHD